MRSVPLFRRFCGLVLLLLALLPVTAPFSTLDIVAFVHGTPADAGSLHQQHKAGGDKPAPEAAAVIAFAVLHAATVCVATGRGAAFDPPHLLDIPLRL